MSNSQEQKLIQALGSERLRLAEPLAPYTTFRLGGPADWFFVAQSTAELVGAVTTAKEVGVDFLILGGGSNLLVADGGYRGLVIKNETRQAAKLEGNRVRVESGFPLPKFIDWCFDQGLTGLEWFGGIPGTVGGAIYNNAHGRDQFFNDRVQKTALLTKEGVVKEEPVDYLQSAYDYTILKETREIILEAFLKLEGGDVGAAKKVRLDWWQEKKKFQPQTNCPGCIFKNISEADQKRLEYPTRSTGYLIDRGLGLRGLQIGGAKVCETHANFIVNIGSAAAADVWAVIQKIQQEAKEKLEVNLELEIDLVGF